VLGRLDRVLANLRLFVERKRALGSQTPHIEWQFIVMRQNQHQIPDAEKLADEIGVDSILFKKVDFPLWEQDTETATKWLPSGLDEYEREHAFERPYKEDGDRCWRLWRSAVINWDGGAAPCCYLTDKNDDFGDVTNSSFKSIWNGNEYTTARKLFKKNIAEAGDVGCRTCPVYTGSDAARLRGDHVDAGAPQPTPIHLDLSRGRERKAGRAASAVRHTNGDGQDRDVGGGKVAVLPSEDQ
jgi:radical SAM protein with 4Fe4S-binding SPASM domain